MSDSEDEEMAETATKLDSALDASKDDVADDADATDESSINDANAADLDDLLDRAMDDVDALLTAYESDDPFEDVSDDLDDLIAVIEEIEELLETVDLAALPDTVDLSELPDAIEAGDVPDAIAEGDPGEAVKYRKLLQVVELGKLWDSVNVREFWRNKRELDDATDAVLEEDDDGGPIETLREFVGDDESDSDDDSDSSGSGGATDIGSSSERTDIDVPTETIQQRVQSKLSDAVGEFRESLLDTRNRIEDLKEENEDRVESVEQPDSRNPTAYSSLPTDRSDVSAAAKFSTVPEETRYSSAPNRSRLYGSRLDRAAEEQDE
jgi:hypothetical protein